MRRIAMLALAAGATALMATGASGARQQIGVELGERVNDAIPLKLSCPLGRKSCRGDAAFKGKKEYRGKIYRLESAPFDFVKFRGGTKKTIFFRLSESAKRTLKRANGMTVTFTVNARYGSGKPGTVRIRGALEP